MMFHTELIIQVFFITPIMLQLFTYILSPLFHLYYGLVFLITHPIQYAAHKLGGEKARLTVINGLNYTLTRGLYLITCRISIKGIENLPSTSRPVIIVSNHQSTYDIPIIGYLFRKNNVKFVAKSSLGKGIPTVSYNLVHGKSALVDRNNAGQSIREIFKLGKLINENNFAACIYPEGTRSKTGKVKKFQSAGLAALLRAAPNALIIPFAISGHAQLIKNSKIWLKIGQEVNYTICPAIDPKEKNLDELSEQLRALIKGIVEN